MRVGELIAEASDLPEHEARRQLADEHVPRRHFDVTHLYRLGLDEPALAKEPHPLGEARIAKRLLFQGIADPAPHREDE